jgi:hypothetical protein
MSGKDDFPTLFQYALDTLSCPVMSTEHEQVFSNVKKLITSERSQLEEDIIEAHKCLKAWWRPDRAAVWTFQEVEVEVVGGSEVVSFNSRAEICTLRSQRYSFSTTPHFWLYTSLMRK